MSDKPRPREVLSRAFARAEFELGGQAISYDGLADIALKALKEAGFGLWQQVDEKDDEW